MTAYLSIMCLGFLATVAVTPLVRVLARKFRLLDRPDGYLKQHGQAVPLGGGCAILLGLLCATALAFSLPGPWRESLAEHVGSLAGLLIGAVVIFVVGLVDDAVGLHGRQKLLGQLCAAMAVMGFGLSIESIHLFGWQLDLGLLVVPFTLFWLLGAMNGLNLLDGADGVATSVAVLLSLTAGTAGLIGGQHVEAVVAFALAGSLLGFLYFNFPPASIFLGDAGSMFVGLVAGVLTLRTFLVEPATVSLAAALAVWTILIFDTAAAIVRRKLTGRTIYTCDRAHLHHRLRARGCTSRQTVGWIASLCALTAGIGLLSLYFRHDALDALSVLVPLLVVTVLISKRVFGYPELRLLISRLRNIGLSLITPLRRQNGQVHQASIRVQGSRRWDDVWSSLTEFAEQRALSSVRLDVSVPGLQEEYHASWERSCDEEPYDVWRAEIPLISQDHTVGRLEIAGTRNGDSVCAHLGCLTQLLKPIETRVLRLSEHGSDISS